MSIEELIATRDATDLAAEVRAGRIAPSALVEAAIARAEKVNPEINAIAERAYDMARAEAETVDRELPFAGVPIAIKDLVVSLKGVPCHSGSNMPPILPDHDSTIVTRFRAAGFIPVMTSTSPEFGLRLMTESARFGVTRNPWDTARTPGGSSGGAAALVAGGVVPVAHASDGGGSIRVPAACTGLVGMKPGRGRVPLTPEKSEGWSGMIAQHAVTRSVRDSAAMLDLVSGPDPLSPYAAARQPEGSFAAAAARDPGPLRIGVFGRSPLGHDYSADTADALAAAAAAAQGAGHAVEEIDLPMVGRDFLTGFARLVAAHQAAEIRAHSDRLGGASPLAALERATRILSRFGEVLGAGEVLATRQRLDETSRGILDATRGFDLVLMPLLAHPPLHCGEMDPTGADLLSQKALDALRLTRLLKVGPLFDKLLDDSFWFTPWSPIQNVTGQPAISLPVHLCEDGLPMGIQAVGRMGDEATLYSFAAQMEQVIGWRERHAPMARVA